MNVSHVKIKPYIMRLHYFTSLPKPKEKTVLERSACPYETVHELTLSQVKHINFLIYGRVSIEISIYDIVTEVLRVESNISVLSFSYKEQIHTRFIEKAEIWNVTSHISHSSYKF